MAASGKKEFSGTDRREAWKAMKQLRSAGLVGNGIPVTTEQFAAASHGGLSPYAARGILVALTSSPYVERAEGERMFKVVSVPSLFEDLARWLPEPRPGSRAAHSNATSEQFRDLRGRVEALEFGLSQLAKSIGFELPTHNDEPELPY